MSCRVSSTQHARGRWPPSPQRIELYWSIGEYISRKIADEEWGKGPSKALAEHIQRRQPGRSGFSASNLWRMRQFFETYRDEAKLAPLVRELSWTHNLLILGNANEMKNANSTSACVCASVGESGTWTVRSPAVFSSGRS